MSALYGECFNPLYRKWEVVSPGETSLVSLSETIFSNLFYNCEITHDTVKAQHLLQVIVMVYQMKKVLL